MKTLVKFQKIRRISLTIFFSSIFFSAVVIIYIQNYNNKPGPYTYPNKWQLALFDDFTSPSLDMNIWSYNYPYDWPHEGHTHNHQAYMDEANVLLENGFLRLIGENKHHPNAPEPEYAFGKYLTYNYTAGAINTREKFNFTGGYIEGRFRMPATRGFWPAFWMLKDAEIGLPEIDILEILSSSPNTLYTTVHYGHSWSSYKSYGWMSVNHPDLSLDFHTYGVEVTESTLKWFLDGKRIGIIFRDKYWLEQCTDLFVIINLAIGGWEVNPDTTTIWPAYFDCDWIKVWQLI